jgi:DNA-cytosine methyltransferase
MTHAALFNGIGGFQVAAEWMGWDNYMSCEIDDFCNRVTKHHFPNCTQHYDIRNTDFTIYRGLIGILTGGFPCQPYSVAGKQKGTEDERHLWPEMLRAIREIQPSWVVGENVLGVIGWNNGLVFDQIQVDLEAEGYEVQPYVFPAASIGAPHRRDRVWFVAYAKCKGLQGFNTERQDLCLHQEPTQPKYSNGNVFKWFDRPRRTIKHLRNGNGIPSQLHKQGVKALGNAIVPQVVHQIFKAINQYELLTNPI